MLGPDPISAALPHFSSGSTRPIGWRAAAGGLGPRPSTCCPLSHPIPVTASTLWAAMWKTTGSRVDDNNRLPVVHLPVTRVPTFTPRHPHPDPSADLGKQQVSTGSTSHMTTMTEFFRLNEKNPNPAAGDCGCAVGHPGGAADSALQQDVWHTRPGTRAGTRPGGMR